MRNNRRRLCGRYPNLVLLLPPSSCNLTYSLRKPRYRDGRYCSQWPAAYQIFKIYDSRMTVLLDFVTGSHAAPCLKVQISRILAGMACLAHGAGTRATLSTIHNSTLLSLRPLWLHMNPGIPRWKKRPTPQ